MSINKQKLDYLESLGFDIQSYDIGEQSYATFTDKDSVDFEISLDDFEVGNPMYMIYQKADQFSCCGDILDKDYMICPSCKEHC